MFTKTAKRNNHLISNHLSLVKSYLIFLELDRRRKTKKKRTNFGFADFIVKQDYVANGYRPPRAFHSS